jgi:hypothetical protein
VPSCQADLAGHDHEGERGGLHQAGDRDQATADEMDVGQRGEPAHYEQREEKVGAVGERPRDRDSLLLST